MEKFRIGNTLLAEWPITVVPFAELSSLNLRLEMTMPDGEKATMPFTIEDGNVINMYYQGKDQKQLGKYRLKLWHNESEDNQHVIDACDAFQLVPCTCKEGGEPSSVIAVRNVEILQGTLNIGAGYAPNAVLYVPQTLTDGQQAQARQNIGVHDVTGLLTDLTTQEKQNLVAAINELVSAKLNKEINITDGKVIFSEQSDGLYIFTELNGQLETYIWIRTDGLYVNGRKVATINDAYTKAETDSMLEDKVDKVTGKGLSTNDYDNQEKSKLAGSLAYILGESTELPSGDTTMSIVYLKNDGEKGKVSLPLITPDNYGQNAYGIIRGEDFGKFNEKAEKTFIAVYGVTPYNDVKAAYEAGTTIICQHSGIYEPLVSAAANTFTFCTLLNKMRFISSLNANGWVEIDAETLATAADLAGKQDTISDLESIRSGASSGATAIQYIPQQLTEAQKAQARDNIADTTRRPFGRNMYPEEFVYRDGSHQLNTDGTWKSGLSSVFIFKITKKHDRVRETYGRAFICEGWNETGLVNPVAFSAMKELTNGDVGKYIAVCHTSGYNGPMFSVYGENVWFEDDLTDKEIQAELDIIHSLYRPNEYKFNALTSVTTTMYISPLKDCNGNVIRHVMGGCDDELGNQAWRYMVNRNDMQYANHCNLLLRHYVQRYNTSGVTSMYCAFSRCSYLESADLHYLDMSSVTSVQFMFRGCSSLTTLDVSGWNVGAVTSVQSMFDGCSSLTTLDVSGWNVGAVTSVQSMFRGCSSLTTLIGGSQDLTKVAFSGLNVELSLNDTQLDRASLRAVINGLADRTGQTQLTLTLGNTLKAKLTDEDILIATNKNWRIA